ncbi:putative D-aminoacylase [Ilyonectria robusta]
MNGRFETSNQDPTGLESIQPLIEAMCNKAGVPGIAVGVIHHGNFYEFYHGRRDVEADLPVDRNTIFHVASLTKAMTATALGILVDRNKLQWTTPVHDILPEMSKETDMYAAKLTVLDILSHRTGKAWADALYLESNNRILLAKDQAIPTFDYLPQVEPVRSKYMYNNHAYNIAGLVIERVSGVSWDTFVSENLFSPLGMTRTFTSNPDDDNVAAPYNILTNRTPHRLPFCNVSNETMMFAGQSVRTSMADLLKYARAYLQALESMMPKNEAPVFTVPSSTFQPSSPTSPANPIREIATIIRPRVARPVDSLWEQTYALGWNRTQLPGKLDFGWNKDMLEPFPLLGERYPGKLVIWHGGNMPGTTSAICLLPESKTAVVVLQNSLGLCDIADWTCQAIIDKLMLGEPAQDYLSLVSNCIDSGVQRMDKVEMALEKERIAGTNPRPLETYEGRYFNRIKNWFIDIKVTDGQLYLEFLGRADERYQLRHYHYDTFSWNLSYNATVERAQYIRTHEYYRFEFEATSDGGGISGLRWRHDKAVPGGELFKKETEQCDG